MRVSKIENETFNLLYASRYIEAVNAFRETCNGNSECEHNSDCLHRCLIPKLRYMSLTDNNDRVDQIIADLLELWPSDDREKYGAIH